MPFWFKFDDIVYFEILGEAVSIKFEAICGFTCVAASDFHKTLGDLGSDGADEIVCILEVYGLPKCLGLSGNFGLLNLKSPKSQKVHHLHNLLTNTLMIISF